MPIMPDATPRKYDTAPWAAYQRRQALPPRAPKGPGVQAFLLQRGWAAHKLPNLQPVLAPSPYLYGPLEHDHQQVCAQGHMDHFPAFWDGSRGQRLGPTEGKIGHACSPRDRSPLNEVRHG